MPAEDSNESVGLLRLITTCLLVVQCRGTADKNRPCPQSIAPFYVLATFAYQKIVLSISIFSSTHWYRDGYATIEYVTNFPLETLAVRILETA